MQTNTTVAPRAASAAPAKQPYQALKTWTQRPDVLAAIKQACTKHLTPDRVLRVCLTAAMGNEKIAEAVMHPIGQASLMSALLKASQRGLEVDGRQAHLVPFRDNRQNCMTIQLIAGWQGLVDLAYNHPKVKSIWAEVVYDKDEFGVLKGLSPDLRHIPYDGEDDPGPIKAAYAVCQLDGGGKVFVVLRSRDIKKITDFSRSASSPSSPWTTHRAAMWMKSAVRQLCKIIPQSSELRMAMNDDDEAESPIIDVTSSPSFQMPADAPQVGDQAQQQAEGVDDGDLGPQPRATQAAKPAAAAPAKPAPAKSAPKPKAPPAPAAPPPEPEPADNDGAIDVQAEAQPAQPAGQTEPSEEVDAAMLRALVTADGFNEEKVVQKICQTFRLSPCSTFDEIYEMAPARIMYVHTNWATFQKGVAR